MKKFLVWTVLLVGGIAQAVDLGKGRPSDLFHIHHAPDPVNVRNGNFYLPLPLYYQSCFGFPLEVYLSYNSFSSRDGPFGKGWTFNYDVKITVGERGALKIVEPDGFVNEYVAIESAQADQDNVIRKIVEAKKKEDIQYTKNPGGKGEAYYKDIEGKLKNDPAYFERQRDRYAKGSVISTKGKYVSYSRGTTHLEVKPSGYLRTLETGQSEEYNKEGQPLRISDRFNNELTFDYDSKSQLSKISDGCGNSLQLFYNKSGKVEKITDSFSKQLSFTYGSDLMLASTKDMEGKVIAFTYNTRNQMTSMTFKEDGDKVSIFYDPKNGRVISQDGPGKKRTTYDYQKTGGIQSTRVKDNEGENTLYEYEDAKNKISQTDANGLKTTTILSECCGKPVLIETSDGVKDKLEYDQKGKLLSKTDIKGNKIQFEYEPRFDQVSEIREPDGKELRYRYDQNGNVSFAKKTFPDGTSSFVKMSYEKHGKIDGIVDDREQEVKFSYSNMGKTQSIELWQNRRRTAQIKVQYKKDGSMENLEYLPNRPETANMIKNTLRGYLELLGPAGIDFEI